MSNVNLQIEFIVSLIKQVSYVDYAHHASKRISTKSNNDPRIYLNMYKYSIENWS